MYQISFKNLNDFLNLQVVDSTCEAVNVVLQSPSTPFSYTQQKAVPLGVHDARFLMMQAFKTKIDVAYPFHGLRFVLSEIAIFASRAWNIRAAHRIILCDDRVSVK